MDFMESRRQERMQAYISGAELDARTYNLIMGGTVVYGLVMNVLACLFLTDFALRIHPIGFLVGYIALCIAGTLISARSDNPVISFLGYNLIVLPVGLVVSISVYYYGGLSSPVVYQAFILTACITVVMTALLFRQTGRYAVRVPVRRDHRLRPLPVYGLVHLRPVHFRGGHFQPVYRL